MTIVLSSHSEKGSFDFDFLTFLYCLISSLEIYLCSKTYSSSKTSIIDVYKRQVKSLKPVFFEFDFQVNEIYADAEYIEEVFSNMIDNSIKYSKERVNIKISSSSNNLYNIIKICDDGLGISEKDLRNIFDKYERVAASRSRKKQTAGFGLGLNFVQQVVEAHNGRIIVNSIKGCLLYTS